MSGRNLRKMLIKVRDFDSDYPSCLVILLFLATIAQQSFAAEMTFIKTSIQSLLDIVNLIGKQSKDLPQFFKGILLTANSLLY
jgi:hypothetical protein